ncbi:MAG: hypothetical protein GY862_19400 [Gammaproteobacteria bacterium]|nr:hypothetical protein [Gammaproteobacteria bacterium]
MTEEPEASSEEATEPVIVAELTDTDGNPIEIEIDEDQARQLVALCGEVFGWDVSVNMDRWAHAHLCNTCLAQYEADIATPVNPEDQGEFIDGYTAARNDPRAECPHPDGDSNAARLWRKGFEAGLLFAEKIEGGA